MSNLVAQSDVLQMIGGTFGLAAHPYGARLVHKKLAA